MRLIDADALIDDVDGDLTDAVAESIAIEKIENAPTIDAVPVVLCGECKHYVLGKCRNLDLEMYHNARRPNWFCADGERK